MMKRSLFHLLLALSLLFNVFFVMGFLQAQAVGAETEDDMARLVPEMLNLDEAQAQTYRDLRSQMQQEGKLLNDAIALAESELLEEINKRTMDLDKVRSLIVRRGDLDQQLRQAQADRLGEFLAVLRPEQCQELGRKLRRGDRHPPRRPSRSMDTNGDGEIDDAERAAAKEMRQRLRTEGEGRYRQMVEQFDADGDGKLSPEERDAMHQQMRRNGPPPRDRRGGRPEDGGRRGTGGGGKRGGGA